MKHRDIPPKLVIFMDQTGKTLMGTSSKTYEKRGSKQIDLAAKDKKRAYTLCVATTADGDILPFQQVWSGKTRNSLPSDRADGMTEVKELGFDFAFAASEKKTSHFSTLKTMKEVHTVFSLPCRLSYLIIVCGMKWVRNILVPYIQNTIDSDPDLRDILDQKAILMIDCYPVHIGQPFRFFVLEEHPNIYLAFVPANCTSIFQVADVGLQ